MTGIKGDTLCIIDAMKLTDETLNRLNTKSINLKFEKKQDAQDSMPNSYTGCHIYVPIQPRISMKNNFPKTSSRRKT